MEIRPMKLKDIIQVRDLEIMCIREYFSEILENKWEELPQEWKDDLGASSKKAFGTYLESGLSFVAEDDGEIIGFIFAQIMSIMRRISFGSRIWVCTRISDATGSVTSFYAHASTRVWPKALL